MNIENLRKNQSTVFQLLKNSFIKGRLVHAYIFDGPRGTNKSEMALFLATMLVCDEEEKPCLTCNNCKRVLNESHPNLVMIRADGATIKKEQIEDLVHNFSLTSVEANNRVYIIESADKMTPSAANSLLKFLEEPHKNIYGILLTERVNALLPTIRSRSQIITFSQINREQILANLINKGIEEEISRVLLTITNDEAEIHHLIKDGEILDIIDLVKNLSVFLLTAEESPLTFFFSNGQFLFERDQRWKNEIFIDLLLVFLTDQLYYIKGNTKQIVFSETIANLASYIQRDEKKLLRQIETILEYKERLNYNVNLELMYTEMMLFVTR